MQLWDFFQGTPERVRKSRGKGAISVPAIEVLLYLSFGRMLKARWTAMGKIIHILLITGTDFYFHDSIKCKIRYVGIFLVGL